MTGVRTGCVHSEAKTLWQVVLPGQQQLRFVALSGHQFLYGMHTLVSRGRSVIKEQRERQVTIVCTWATYSCLLKRTGAMVVITKDTTQEQLVFQGHHPFHLILVDSSPDTLWYAHAGVTSTQQTQERKIVPGHHRLNMTNLQLFFMCIQALWLIWTNYSA